MLTLSLLSASLFLFGCESAQNGNGSRLAVKAKDFTAFGQDPIQVTVIFTKPVDRNTLVPGQSLILAGAIDQNA